MLTGDLLIWAEHCCQQLYINISECVIHQVTASIPSADSAAYSNYHIWRRCPLRRREHSLADCGAAHGKTCRGAFCLGPGNLQNIIARNHVERASVIAVLEEALEIVDVFSVFQREWDDFCLDIPICEVYWLRCTDLLNSGMFTPHVLYLFSWTLDVRLQSKNSFPEWRGWERPIPATKSFYTTGLSVQLMKWQW